MIDTGIERGEPPSGTSGSSAAALFQRQWRIYRKVVDNDYLFHREAYERLHNLLIAELAGPFYFLDVACGDASATVDALKGTQVAHYQGIDVSRSALDIAEQTLGVLSCPVNLYESDFVQALKDWHHWTRRKKLNVMRDVRRIVGGQGVFAVYENTSPDGEDREHWHRRWDLQKLHWTAYTMEEWDAITAHVHASDIPETASRWHELGHEAGFSNIREVFTAPSDLFRMYVFRE
jgi:hypothetical protein